MTKRREQARRTRQEAARRLAALQGARQDAADVQGGRTKESPPVSSQQRRALVEKGPAVDPVIVLWHHLLFVAPDCKPPPLPDIDGDHDCALTSDILRLLDEGKRADAISLTLLGLHAGYQSALFYSVLVKLIELGEQRREWPRPRGVPLEWRDISGWYEHLRETSGWYRYLREKGLNCDEDPRLTDMRKDAVGWLEELREEGPDRQEAVARLIELGDRQGWIECLCERGLSRQEAIAVLTGAGDLSGRQLREKGISREEAVATLTDMGLGSRNTIDRALKMAQAVAQEAGRDGPFDWGKVYRSVAPRSVKPEDPRHDPV
jgi:hypothetical protein